MTSTGSTAPGYTKHSDLAYAAGVGRAHLLDLYVPTGVRGPFPVVIVQLGSAFMSDDTKSGRPAGGPPPGVLPPLPGGSADAPTGLGGMTTAQVLAQRWGPRGYATVGLNVRSSSQAKFPAQVHDVKAAIRYLRASAPQFDLDVDRFAAMGTSSGAWTALMAGTTAGVPELEGDLGNADQRSDVQAVIDLFGPTDFLQMDAHRLPDGQLHDPETSPESQLLGFAIQTNPAAVQRANPAAYVSRESPPVYIAHGLADPIVPHHQSQLLFTAYEAARATASLTLVPEATHTDSYLDSADDSAGRTVQHTRGGRTSTGSEPAPTYDALLAFLDEHLRR
ncbi:Alpha/beta hydrolase family protein [Geodermatophilus siccatus]|uniref:Alpha/beta hydrolase family protein n=1 Tax=Geodermatophilus siccatus TaxID=1137991 RepID=A0A1G9QML0_9ACTN|nr:alpha/beta hydrolase [Geodermatophilus siccatus]SDM11545.1 Alpha/beta hydrolase family protein [Geodermatophilus siccatus]